METGNGAGTSSGQTPAAVGRFWRAFAVVVVALRFPIVIGWIAAAVAATFFLPGIAASGAIGGLIPPDSPALRAEADAAKLFGEPLASAQVAVVQRDPGKFPSSVQAGSVQHAISVDKGQVKGIPGLAGALPVANTAGLFPGSREKSTTIITFLLFRPGTPADEQVAGAQSYARRYLSAPQDHLAGVTGPVAAEDTQGKLILRYLPWVELGTVLAIALIVGFHFRSAGAPLASLACSAAAYFTAVRLVGWMARRYGLTVPPDLEPVLVVLLLGVTTDYSVFFLAGMQARLAEGLSRVQAARRTTAEFAPIIITAGVVVAAGIASLAAAARISALQAFGPALALTVLIAMVVAVTLAPALIGIFGSLLFRGLARPAWSPRSEGTWRDRAVRIVTIRPVAALTAVACVAALAAGAWGLGRLRLGFPLTRALPASAQAAHAQAAASKGFVPGVLSPTEILVIGPGMTGQQAALGRLQHAFGSRPGVAGVIGPSSYPAIQQRLGQPMLARSGGAARYILIQRTDPLGPTAIGQVNALRSDLPEMARAAGLRGVRFEAGGETALAGEAIQATTSSLWRIGVVIGVLIVILLALFLRALAAAICRVTRSPVIRVCRAVRLV